MSRITNPTPRARQLPVGKVSSAAQKINEARSRSQAAAQNPPPTNGTSNGQNGASKMPPPTNTPARPMQPYRKALADRESSIAAIVPAGYSVARLFKAVELSFAKSKGNKLAACTVESVVYSVTLIATTGLELGGPMAEVHLVPYKGECTASMGYRGIIKLCKRGNPELLDISAYDVREGDAFAWQLGTDARIEHMPRSGDRDSAPVTHCYAVATFRGTDQKKFVVLDRSEIERARENSPTGNFDDSPWRTHYAEMAKKTAIFRLGKTLPMSADVAAVLGETIEHDPTMGYRTPDGVEVMGQPRSPGAAVLGRLKALNGGGEPAADAPHDDNPDPQPPDDGGGQGGDQIDF